MQSGVSGWIVLAACGATPLAAAGPATTQATAPTSAPATQPEVLRIPGLPAAQWLHVEQPVSAQNLMGRLWLLGVLEPWAPRSVEAAGHLARVRARRGVDAFLLTVDPAGEGPTVEPWQALPLPIGTDSPLPMLLPLEPLPRVYLVGPDLAVLWSGPVEHLEPALDGAYLAHTPEGLTPQRAKEVADWLGRAEAALRRDEHFTSVGLASIAVAATPASHALHRRAQDLLETLSRLADQRLTEAEQLLARRRVPEAYDALHDVAEEFYGLPAASRALATLQDVQADPQRWSDVLRARNEASAEHTLKLAEQAAAAGRYAQAQRYYEVVARVYAQTRSAPAARRALRRLERDRKIAPELARQQAEPDAPVLLSLADRYSQMGRFEQARQYYRRVIERFPDTPYAQEARARLSAVPATSPATREGSSLGDAPVPR